MLDSRARRSLLDVRVRITELVFLTLQACDFVDILVNLVIRLA
jgi:hypothetical protein